MSIKNNYNPHRRLEALVSSASSRQIYKTLVLSLFLVCLSFVLLPTIIMSANATTEVNAAVNWSPVSLLLDTDYGNGSIGNAGHGDISFSVTAPSSVGNGNLGTQVVSKKTIGIETSGKYYAVYLSTGKNDADLTLSDSNLKIEGTSGTISSPSAFTTASWGFAVPSTSNFSTSFSSASVYANYDSSLGSPLTASSSNVYNTGTWASVPTLNEGAKLIQSATTTNPSGFGGENGDKDKSHFDIYYSVIVDNTFVAGSYTNTIVYTALASGGLTDSVSNRVARNLRFGTSGDIETLTIDLASSVPSLNKDLVSVYLVPHSVTEANKETDGSYTTTGLSSYKTSTYNCPITSFSSSNESQATISCTIPTNPDGKTAGGSTMDGEYDFWVHIDTYNYDYVSRYKETNTEVASFVYAGLQTKKRNNTDYVITKMQEMTGSICKNTNQFGTQVGASATVYNYTGSGTALSTGLNATLPSNTSTTGTFELTDIRDNNTYLVRRLADGNCWMVQNLDLNLATFAGTKNLTKDNTDLSTKDYWDPSESMEGKTLVSQIGSPAGCEQFVSYGKNTVNGNACFWGSKIGDNGEALSSAMNNARAAIPRSYNNGNDWIDNSSPTADGSSSFHKTSGAPSNTSTDAAATQYIGNYYNWYAATAESGGYNSTNITAESSICPKGWRLPNDTGELSFTNLASTIYGNAHGFTNGSEGLAKMLRQTPMSLIFAGSLDGETGMTGAGRVGHYWEANSRPEPMYANNFYFTHNYPSITSGTNKFSGASIRCVSRD